MSRTSIELLRPKSVAIVGATPDRHKYSARPLANLVSQGFTGRVYPVNPRHAEVEGIRAYARVVDLPEAPDLVIVTVPAAHVPGVLEDCGARGARAATVISGGFKEVGNHEQERRIAEIAAKYGMWVLGPNCTGFINFHDGIAATSSMFFRDGKRVRPGPIALVTQSGGLGISILRALFDRGESIGYSIAVGNEASVTAAECVEMLASAPEVGVIGVYCEGIQNGRHLIEAAATAKSLGKTVAILKAGWTRLGQQAAETHTGSLAGGGETGLRLLREGGAAVVGTPEELVDVLTLQAANDHTQVSSLGMLTSSGGLSVMTADTCEVTGVRLGQLRPETASALKLLAPPRVAVANPLDLGIVTDDTFAAGRIMVDAKEFDALLVCMQPEDVNLRADAIAALASRAAVHGKPIVLGLAGIYARNHVSATAVATLRDAHVALLDSPLIAVRTIAAVQTQIGRTEGTRSLRTTGQLVRMEQAFEVVARARVATPVQRFVGRGGDAAAAASEVGFPVVLKIDSVSVSHKSDEGGVVLGLRSQDDVRVAQAALESKLVDLADGRLLVQRQITDLSVEVLVGGLRSAEFGDLILVGTGGRYSELYRDVACGLAPRTAEEALALLRKTAVYSLLTGYRGGPVFDIDACAAAVVAVASVLASEPSVRALEINPLLVLQRGCVAADARLVEAPS